MIRHFYNKHKIFLKLIKLNRKEIHFTNLSKIRLLKIYLKNKTTQIYIKILVKLNKLKTKFNVFLFLHHGYEFLIKGAELIIIYKNLLFLMIYFLMV